MGEFYVDDKHTFKKEQRFRDQGYVVYFLFCVVENDASDGAKQWREIIRISQSFQGKHLVPS
jgi:hypothetical protein